MSQTDVRTLTITAALMLTVTSLAQAQSANPAWLDQLSEQLAIEKDCAVEYFLNLKEGELAGRLTFAARAQCADGRQFDGALTEPANEFTITACGVQVC
ncbi:hypothetical protein PZ897_02860 [Hoeflea sp. YIM 152468]|uniref:hypothetical protein n=1 Tax=Hoeflea sp. YIM 152468 TaxID=3031759 RepID=UPI0023DC7553|nr:hypothetical protein [Hoeflea sp. YIM 152468]MDF1607109.1 hypothetical protein [Hoeflea sp. YIM 152468]